MDSNLGNCSIKYELPLIDGVTTKLFVRQSVLMLVGYYKVSGRRVTWSRLMTGGKYVVSETQLVILNWVQISSWD